MLVIDDEPNILLCFRRAFRDDDLEVITAGSATDGLNVASECRPDVAIVDLCLGDGNGLDVARELRARDPRCMTLLMTAFGTTETVIEATKDGAFEYLLKPLDVAHVRSVVADALRIRRMAQVPALLDSDGTADEDADSIIGRCPAMQTVYKAIGRVAPQDVNVLILGESGTGKELVARAIFQHSARSKAKFLAVNCAAIPDSLLESELFGHERGAFTGADRRRIGKFEQCHGGTLFLDEIGELPLPTQAKLLRVLQERTLQPVGGQKTIQADVRIIAATNRDLKKSVDAGLFRADLYYRLAAFVIEIPPLRERPGDLQLLVEHLVARLNRKLRTAIHDVHPSTMELLHDYEWPGNVRELENTLSTMMLHATGGVLLPDFLPDWKRSGDAGLPIDAPDTGDFRPRETLAELIDRDATDIYDQMTRKLDQMILQTLWDHTGGNIVQMSRILGISRNTLKAKLRSTPIARRIDLLAEVESL